MNFRLSERIPGDNFYRRLKESLDLEYLRSQTKRYCGSERQKSIDPVEFFKLMLAGYLKNNRSDRKIMLRRCAEEGLVDGKTQAVGSALIKARASMGSLAERGLSEKSTEGKRMRRLRSATVEPALGTLLNFRRMRKV